MSRWSLIAVFVMLVGAAAASVSAQPQSARRGGAQEGHRLALGKCDVCHVVASDQQYQPLLSHYAPSFYDVANRSTTTAQSLEAFLAHPHGYQSMPYPELTPAQVTDLVTYIVSLRGRH